MILSLINISSASINEQKSIYAENHRILVYVTDDISESFVKEKINIAMFRLEKFSGTSWYYDIKKIYSIHKDWNWDSRDINSPYYYEHTELNNFWKDVYNQTNLKNDFDNYEHFILITSHSLITSNSHYGFVKINIKAIEREYDIDMITKDSYSYPVIEHEILHEYNLIDTYDEISGNFFDNKNRCIGNIILTKDDKIDLCGQILNNKNKVEYNIFLSIIGLNQLPSNQLPNIQPTQPIQKQSLYYRTLIPVIPVPLHIPITIPTYTTISNPIEGDKSIPVKIDIPQLTIIDYIKNILRFLGVR